MVERDGVCLSVSDLVADSKSQTATFIDWRCLRRYS
jgi:hypothetical protein